MPRYRLPVIFAVATLAASCAPTSTGYESLRLSPEQAVINAAQSPEGTHGVFEMVVRGTGRENGRLYLNSQTDYRDPRSLTIAISPAVEQSLAQRLRGPVDETLMTKTIAVRGTAKKTRIWFTYDGQATSKYYFQTHIELESARELTVEGAPAFF